MDTGLRDFGSEWELYVICETFMSLNFCCILHVVC